MSDLFGLFSESVKRVSQVFLTAFYLPAALFVAIHAFILFPAWQNPHLTLLGINPAAVAQGMDLSQWLLGLALPALLGLILLGLNHGIIVLYEGRAPILKKTIFRFAYQRQLRRHKRYYAPLAQLRKEYRRLAVELATGAGDAQRSAALHTTLGGLRQQIETVEDALEQQPRLPLDPERINPTAFGNTYALAEEYPLERYGIDAVLFWPRLRDLMDTHAKTLSERLSQQKTQLDLVLNLSCLSGVIAGEAALTLLLGGALFLFPVNTVLWASIGGIALAFMLSFYRESVRVVATQGELIKTSFDFHRHLMLSAFKLKVPADLMQEQILWVRLAAFIRRGHPFYFPATYTEPAQPPAAKPPA